MKRSLWVTLAWLSASLGLYLSVLALELYWNLYDWQPRDDWKACGMALAASGLLVGMWFLAEAAAKHPISQGAALLASVCLMGLGIYVLPPEPLTQGLFARTAASPFWYRASRLVVMGLPGVFCALALRRHIVLKQRSC